MKCRPSGRWARPSSPLTHSLVLASRRSGRRAAAGKMSSTSALSTSNVLAALQRLAATYSERTSTRLKLVDAFLLFVLVTGIVQFVYCILVGTFPYNSFLSGFISTVGTFVLAGTLAEPGLPCGGERRLSSASIGALTLETRRRPCSCVPFSVQRRSASSAAARRTTRTCPWSGRLPTLCSAT